MTFKDFIKECDAFKYSKENYELMKECAELDLLNKLIDNQDYLSENEDILFGDEAVITESYFQESMDEDSKDNLKDKAMKKAKKIWDTIKRGFVRLIIRLGTFLSKLQDKYKKLLKFDEDYKKYFKSHTLTPEMVEKIKEIINKNTPGKVIKDFKPNRAIKIKFPDGISTEDKDLCSKYINLGITNYIKIMPKDIPDLKGAVMNFASIIDIMVVLFADRKVVYPDQIEKANKLTKKYIQKCEKSGFWLYTTLSYEESGEESSLKKIAKDLEEMDQELSDSKDMTLLKEIYTMLMEVVKNLITTYGYVTNMLTKSAEIQSLVVKEISKE